MDPRTTPLKLNLKRDEHLEIQWQDGHVCVYPVAYLRKNCPCATCRTFREELAKKPKTHLTVFSKTSEGPLTATSAELVGGYALRVGFSDGHDTGIYSFIYLREICLEEGTEARRHEGT